MPEHSGHTGAPKRVQMDNVIYANFGAKTRITTPEDRPAEIDGPNLSRYSPAARRVVELTLKNTDPQRRRRGEEYYRNGNVSGLTVLEGRMEAEVAGSQNEPFTVLVTFPYRSSQKLRQAFDTIADTTNGIRLVREGALTPAMVDGLVGSAEESIYIDCSCPDRALVCKHAVATAFRIADAMTADPCMVLGMRGQKMAGLETLIRGYHAKAPEEPEDNESFWEGRALPDLPTPKVAAAIDDSDINYLHKALRLISYTSLEQLRAVSDLEDMYEILTTDPTDAAATSGGIEEPEQ